MLKNDRIFYLCACSDQPNGGIYRYTVCPDGAWKQLGFTALPGANFLCFSPDRSYLYATWNTKELGGGMAAYKLDSDGVPTELNRMTSEGKAACYCTTSPNGRQLYCANYSSGSFAEFELASDGSIARRIQVIQHYGSGPRKDRQECAHTHCTLVTPDNKYLCVVDLGIDKIMVYPLGENGICGDAQPWIAAPGSGPRHILFDKSGKQAYVINELGNSVTCVTYADGKFTTGKTFTSLPDGCDAVTKAAAIRLSPDEKFLYASNRGYDSIACYKVKAPGELELFEIIPAHGVSPRDINYLPGQQTFTASNEFSDLVCFYRVDSASGQLTYLADQDIQLPRPLYLLY